MSKDDATNRKDENKAISIVDEWARMFKEYNFGGLNDLEKAQFERAQFAEEQAKRTQFILGEPIRHNFF